MNAMGHKVPTMIGVEQQDLAEKINALIPGYMAMGSSGMAEMGHMHMALPDNTLPMMTGTGPFGGLEMGGMFTVLKVRKDQKPGNYTDPGWFKHPPGSVAYEAQGAVPASTQAPETKQHVHPASHAAPAAKESTLEVQVRKPAHGAGSHAHH